MTTIFNVISDHLDVAGMIFILVTFWYSIHRHRQKLMHSTAILKMALTSGTEIPVSLHPVIDHTKCFGCGTCTRVCPEGKVLGLVNNKSTLIAPTKCVGHGECETACPNKAIRLVVGNKTKGIDIPHLSGHFETNIPGIYIVGELGGMGLIRNAIKQGQLAAQHAITNLNPKIACDTDVFIVGCGPSGLAAALTVVERKKRYICIEQNSFGGTVFNFPRQKIVMTHPVSLPLFGQMKFKKNKISKEQLLAFWNQVRRKARLDVREGIKFETLEKRGKVFHIKTNAGSFTAQAVLLAMGVRGTPRRLGLTNEDLAKVTYNLIDPAEYQGKTIAVMGGGNAAAETAISLSQPHLHNQVTLIVRGNSMDRCSAENLAILEKMSQQKLLTIEYQTTIQEIQPEKLVLKSREQSISIDNDYLFVMIGAELPFKLLESLGIKIEKKFGEQIQHTG